MSLGKLTDLTSLEIGGEKISEEGLAAVQKLLPRCEIGRAYDGKLDPE